MNTKKLTEIDETYIENCIGVLHRHIKQELIVLLQSEEIKKFPDRLYPLLKLATENVANQMLLTTKKEQKMYDKMKMSYQEEKQHLFE